MANQTLIENFAQNFILKVRRERCLYELSNSTKRQEFTGRLNHNSATLFIMEKLIEIPGKADEFQFIKTSLNISDNTMCYLISEYDKLDNHLLDFKTAFEKSRFLGFATLFVIENGNKIYLKTEQEVGPPKMFIGKV